MLKKGLLDRNFKPSKIDPCVFFRDDCIVLCYVDDCIIISKSEAAANKIHENILTCLEQKEITQYSARIEQIANSNLDAFLTPETGNLSQVQFIISFTSNSRTIHEEMQIHDEIWLLGSLGGSLGLWLGLGVLQVILNF